MRGRGADRQVEADEVMFTWLSSWAASAWKPEFHMKHLPLQRLLRNCLPAGGV